MNRKDCTECKNYDEESENYFNCKIHNQNKNDDSFYCNDKYFEPKKNKIEFESEEQAREFFCAIYCEDRTKDHNVHNYNVGIIMDILYKKGYIKKSELEKAREKTDGLRMMPYPLLKSDAKDHLFDHISLLEKRIKELENELSKN